MEPIATYEELRLDRCDSFELYPDRIVVRGTRLLGKRYEREFPLLQLTSQPAQLRAGDPLFQRALAAVTVVGFLLFLLSVAILTDQIAALPPAVWLALGLGLATTGVLAIVNPRRLDFASFYHLSGAPAFGLARLPGHYSAFDSFVQIVTKAIEDAQCKIAQQTDAD